MELLYHFHISNKMRSPDYGTAHKLGVNKRYVKHKVFSLSVSVIYNSVNPKCCMLYYNDDPGQKRKPVGLCDTTGQQFLYIKCYKMFPL